MSVVESSLSLLSSGVNSSIPATGIYPVLTNASPSVSQAINIASPASYMVAPSAPLPPVSSPLIPYGMQSNPVSVARVSSVIPTHTDIVPQIPVHHMKNPLSKFVHADANGNYTFFQLLMVALAAILIAFAIFFLVRWIYKKLSHKETECDEIDYTEDTTTSVTT